MIPCPFDLTKQNLTAIGFWAGVWKFLSKLWRSTLEVFFYDTKLAEAEAELEMKACRCELLPPPAPDQVRLRRLLPLRDRRFWSLGRGLIILPLDSSWGLVEVSVFKKCFVNLNPWTTQFVTSLAFSVVFSLQYLACFLPTLNFERFILWSFFFLLLCRAIDLVIQDVFYIHFGWKK